MARRRAAVLRRLIDSPWLYFALAGLLVVAAIGLQVEFEPPARPDGTVAEHIYPHDYHLDGTWLVPATGGGWIIFFIPSTSGE